MGKNINQLLVETWNKRRIGDYRATRTLVLKAIDSCSSEDFELLGRAYHILRQIESDHDNYDKAIELNLLSLDYYRKSGKQDRIAHSMRHLADLQAEIGNHDEAEGIYKDSIKMYKNSVDQDPLDFANALSGLGQVLETKQKFKEAISTWEEVKRLYSICQLDEGVKYAREKLDKLK